MKNKQQGFIGIAIIILIALAAIGSGAYVYQTSRVNENTEPNQSNRTQFSTDSSDTTAVNRNENETRIEQNVVKNNLVAQVQKCELAVISPAPNSQVSFPLTVKGTVNNTTAGCSWQMFEGQAGTAQLFFNYQNQGWKPIGVSVPVKVADWTAKTTTFEVVLTFNNGGIGLPSGTPMKIVFTAENAAAIEPSKTVEFPIILNTTQNNIVAPQANGKELTDGQVVAALNATFASQNKTKYEYQSQQDAQGKSMFGVSVDNGFNKVDAIYKGDLNNDGYSDALVWVSSCSADNDCAHGLRLVINNKNGTGMETTNLQTPDTISGWSGGSTVFDVVKIENSIVSITSSSFYSSGDWKTASKLPTQTKKFQLQGSKLVEIK